MEDSRILEVKNLVTTFKTERGDMNAIQGVSFHVNKGEIFGVVGESGCGKSVTAQSILRLYDEKYQVKYEGQILFDNIDILKIPEKEMEKKRGKDIAMVFQDALSSLNPVLTIGDQLTEPLIMHQKMNKQQAWNEAVNMLKLVGISAPEKRMEQYPHELSGGMRQRVMIAIALSCHPRLLIADEPTTALDVTIQAQIMDLIVKLNKELDMGVILITHDLAVVAEVCKRVIVMYLGQTLEEAEVNDLFDHPLHPYTNGLLQSIPKLDEDKSKRLHMIKGTVPLLYQIPNGCRFAPRCPFATERCHKEMPQLHNVGQGHNVRCFRFENS